MGMYTGLRFNVIIKKEYRGYLENILNSDMYEDCWTYVKNTPFTKEWAEYSRSSFIPLGAICYMPDDWEHINIYNNTTGEWNVCCSLKNYDSTIEYFLDNILSKIIESSENIEVLYEEYDIPAKYIFKNGKIEQISEMSYFGERKIEYEN